MGGGGWSRRDARTPRGAEFSEPRQEEGCRQEGTGTGTDTGNIISTAIVTRGLPCPLPCIDFRPFVWFCIQLRWLCMISAPCPGADEARLMSSFFIFLFCSFIVSFSLFLLYFFLIYLFRMFLFDCLWQFYIFFVYFIIFLFLFIKNASTPFKPKCGWSRLGYTVHFFFFFTQDSPNTYYSCHDWNMPMQCLNIYIYIFLSKLLQPLAFIEAVSADVLLHFFSFFLFQRRPQLLAKSVGGQF